MAGAAATMRWLFATFFLAATAPTFNAVWFIWRILSLFGPFRGSYETGDDVLYSLYQKLVVFFVEHFVGVELILYGDVDDLVCHKENVLFMSNHQSTVDWLIADVLAVRQGSIGHIRYILKDSLKYLPMYGPYFKQHSCIYVKRSGQFQQDTARQQLEAFAAKKTPFWMVVFPEGTRLNPSMPHVIAKSRTYAQEHGLPIYEQLLTPRTKALQLCFSKLGGNATAVYDITIAYTGTTSSDGHIRTEAPSLSAFLQAKCSSVHIHIKRIPIGEVPTDGTGTGERNQFEKWLHKQFLDKDQRLKRFYSNDPREAGSLGKDGKISALSLYVTLPVFLFWCALNFPLWFTIPGLVLYFAICLIAIVASLIWAVMQP